jgi:hypothetical protein
MEESATSSGVIACWFQDYSKGINNLVTIDALGWSVTGDIALTFPSIPELYSVRGCSDVGNGTMNCPTSGLDQSNNPIILTLDGDRFALPMSIQV